ncbi:MAG: hypothetical protein OXU44_05675 [Gammaproteobacteria bacterium]|nr:hypothetical protein [Gammaproteobacteria bacterium]
MKWNTKRRFPPNPPPGLVALALLLLAPLALAQETGDEYSKEQLLLFDTPHLRNIRSEASLHYDFRQHGAQTEAIENRVTLKITGLSESGGKNLETAFLSGANGRNYAIEDFRGNPLIMYFLEWDVTKMGRESAISRHYFRHLMKQAFLTAAASEEITFTHDGRRIKGHKVFLEPLASRKGDDRYRNYPAKRYEFVLADDIPGGIYSIATRLPGAAPEDGLLEHTEMKFSRIEPPAAFSGQRAQQER